MAEKTEKRKDNFSTRALECMRIEENTHRCIIDPMSGCAYRQDRLDVGNFLRHFRTKHPEASVRLQLVGKTEVPSKKTRTVVKVLVAIDRTILLQGCIKLVTQHHLPLYCFEWEGFRLILDPLTEALKFGINRHSIKNHLSAAAKKIQEAITTEMRGKMVSIMIDSASKHNRHIICIQAQYESGGEIVIRTLGKYLMLKSKRIFFLLSYFFFLTLHPTKTQPASQLSVLKVLPQLLSESFQPKDSRPMVTNPRPSAWSC